MTKNELRNALSESMTHRLADYNNLSVNFSSSFLYRMHKRKIIKFSDRCTRKESVSFVPRLKLRFLIIAIIFATFIVTGFSVTMNIGSFYFLVTPTYSKVYLLDAKNHKSSMEEFYALSDECGFEVTDIIESDIVRFTSYDKFTLEQSIVDSEESLGQINTENAIIEEINVNGNEGFCLSYSNNIGYTAMWWTMDGYIFSICGYIDKEEAVNLAKMTVLK